MSVTQSNCDNGRPKTTSGTKTDCQEKITQSSVGCEVLSLLSKGNNSMKKDVKVC